MAKFMIHKLSIVWLRRDLRLDDNIALHRACAESECVVVIFIFDIKILGRLRNTDQRVTFIYDSLVELDESLKKLGSRLIVKLGDPQAEIPKLVTDLNADAVYLNEDYEPYAKLRDKQVHLRLKKDGITVYKFKDQVIFSGSEVCKKDGKSYKMFTPYKNAWLKKFQLSNYVPVSFNPKKFIRASKLRSLAPIPSLELLGFKRAKFLIKSTHPGRKAALSALRSWIKMMKTYNTDRNLPSLENGTSGLSVHLRFGTVSIRECINIALTNPSLGSKTWLNELIWRDFYQMILDQFPHVAKGSFKPEYDKIKWLGLSAHFRAWCQGRTGFPIVDAGMRQLNQTGWMHNRVRMITASFLVKDLLIDWRKGESYFAEKLLDFDLASNNGGWQWCASTGCDAQPYFRVFNPLLQVQKFDPTCEYIKKWIPELRCLTTKQIQSLHADSSTLSPPDHFKIGKTYPKRIVDHAAQKSRAVLMYLKSIK